MNLIFGQCLHKIDCSIEHCYSCYDSFTNSEKCLQCNQGFVNTFMHRVDFDLSFGCVGVQQGMEHCKLIIDGLCLECHKNYYYAGVNDQGIKCLKRETEYTISEYLLFVFIVFLFP